MNAINKKIVTNNPHYKARLFLAGILCLGIAYILAGFFDRNVYLQFIDIVNNNRTGETPKVFFQSWQEAIQLHNFSGIKGDRILILFLITYFISLWFIFPVKKLFNWLFKYRWCVGLLLLFFLVINRYNGDSLNCYDRYIQHGEKSEYADPIMGIERETRSDEWMVNSPALLSTYYLQNSYGKYNTILDARNTVNNYMITPTRIMYQPQNLIRILLDKTLGRDYSYSFQWYFLSIFGFLISIEFFMMLTKGKKLLSVTCTMMIYFSSFYLWWGFPSHILYAQGALLCVDLFLKERKIIKKILYAYLTAVFTTNFVILLYPAWQVPLGYTVLILLVWIFVKNAQTVKSMKKVEWLIFGTAFMAFLFFVYSYMQETRDYTMAITKTVYPGKRISSGGFSLFKMFNYIPSMLFAFRQPVISNVSEASTFLCLFPIPMILALYYLIKSKKKNGLMIALLIQSVILGFYCTTGLPRIIAKVLLLSYSVQQRTVDILAFIQILLFAIIFSEYKIPKKEVNERLGVRFLQFLAAFSIAAFCVLESTISLKYGSTTFRIIAIIIFTYIFYRSLSQVTERQYRHLMTAIILVALVTGIFVRPISKGEDGIYSKPLAREITSIVAKDKDAVWVTTLTTTTQSFMVACGAKTINYVNTYPNMSFWKKLDPQGKYEKKYNRYCHVDVIFTEKKSSVDLQANDIVNAYVSYKDLHKLKIKYVLLQSQLENTAYFSTQKLYEHNGFYIYKITYK